MSTFALETSRTLIAILAAIGAFSMIERATDSSVLGLLAALGVTAVEYGLGMFSEWWMALIQVVFLAVMWLWPVITKD